MPKRAERMSKMAENVKDLDLLAGAELEADQMYDEAEKLLRQMQSVLVAPKKVLEADVPLPVVKDPTGAVRDWAWAEAWWPAPLILNRAAPIEGVPYVARIVEIQALIGPCTQIVKVIGPEKECLPGVAVCRWWAGAPKGPDFPEDCAATRWQDLFVYGLTACPEGTVGFAMGDGDMPNSSGFWVAHCDAPGDWWGSGGWKPEIEHDTWLVTYQITEVEDEPGPTPTPEGLLRVADLYVRLEPEAE